MKAYKKDRKSIFAILFIIVLGCFAMAVTDAVIQPPYAVKSAIKAVFFLMLPFAYARINKKIQIKKLVLPDRKGIFTAILLGAAVYTLILGAYFVCRNFYDFAPITQMLTENVGVSKENFVWVALYISFVNSLLEEFFFRGFAFILLSEFTGRKFAYLFSSTAFALYHVAIMSGWFSPALFLLAMAGLMAGALIFNFIDSKNKNIYNSWMVHMFANFGINTVGFILFGIL